MPEFAVALIMKDGNQIRGRVNATDALTAQTSLLERAQKLATKLSDGPKVVLPILGASARKMDVSENEVEIGPPRKRTAKSKK